MTEEQNNWSITAHQSWWSKVITAIALCSEKPQSGSEVSFLSCVLVDIHDDSVVLNSESAASSFVIDATKDVEHTGVTRTLIPVQPLRHALSSLPAGNNIVVSGNNRGDINIATEDGSISFTILDTPIIDDDMVPHPPEFPEDTIFTTLDSQEFVTMYNMGSTMAQPIIGSEHIGYDPLSSCIVSLTPDGVQMLSLATSSVETFIPADTGVEENITSTTVPATTYPCLRSMAQFGEDIDCGITPGGMMLLEAGGATMSIVPLNTAGVKKSAVNYESISNVFFPVWSNKYVTLKVNTKELFSATKRAGSVSKERINFSISDSQVQVVGVDGSMPTPPFIQDVPCQTTWHTDGEHNMDYSIQAPLINKVGTMLGKTDEVSITLALSAKGTPWAAVVYTQGFDEEDPHNFFLLPIVSYQR